MAEGSGKRPFRNAEFFLPLNTLRTKVGYGGLSDDVLNEAQMLIEYRSDEFQLGQCLVGLLDGIKHARNPDPDEDSKTLIEDILIAAVNLKANGGMCGYQLVTRIGARLIEFLEVGGELNKDAIDIVLAFYISMQIVLTRNVTGSSGNNGDHLMQELEAACMRYFQRYPGNREPL